MQLVKGNKELAHCLQVSERTISSWKSEGLLNNAIVGQLRRTILYDLDKVYQCMNHHNYILAKEK